MGTYKVRSLLAAAVLRRQAEELLKANMAESGVPGRDDELHRLLHELQVHQIELEMQNAEILQARDELEIVLGKYTDLYDFAPVGYVTLDRTGAVRAVNLSATSLLGVERVKLLGQPFGQFVKSESRPFFSRFLGEVFASQEKVSCEVALTTNKNLPLIVQVEAVTFGSLQECRVALIDITERILMEERTAHLASFPQMNPNPVLEVDSSGRITFFNPATAKTLQSLGLDEADIAAFLPSDMKDIIDNSDWLIEATLYREISIKDKVFGETIFLTPIFRVARIYAFDITERRRADDALQQALSELKTVNIELEAFNFTVSHDLRQPLTILNSYCQMLQEQCGNKIDEKCRGYIHKIYDGTLQMNRLIDTLLNFSLAGRGELHPDTADLSTMAAEITIELKVSDARREATFHIAEGIVAFGDSDLLRVVLDNLIGNAWKYAGNREGAVIEFGVTEIDGNTACFVKDNGPGFDMAQADRLFDPFQRLPGTKGEGHGIGLATVERIIRRHGGRVWAVGEVGKSACFYFTLSADHVST